MHCPRCQSQTLEDQARLGLLVQGCPSCDGVWLEAEGFHALSLRLEDASHPPVSELLSWDDFDEPPRGVLVGH